VPLPPTIIIMLKMLEARASCNCQIDVMNKGVAVSYHRQVVNGNVLTVPRTTLRAFKEVAIALDSSVRRCRKGVLTKNICRPSLMDALAHYR
jgi:hypothetical protein